MFACNCIELALKHVLLSNLITGLVLVPVEITLNFPSNVLINKHYEQVVWTYMSSVRICPEIDVYDLYSRHKTPVYSTYELVGIP